MSETVRAWPNPVPVYNHLGVVTDLADRDRAEYLVSTGDYLTPGNRKRVFCLVRKAPPDGRTVEDEHAMKPKGSQRPVFKHKFYSGVQCWELKPQRKPWSFAGDINLNPGHETPSTGGPDI